MSYRIGFDVGIGSCGWSALKTNQDGVPYKILALGSVVFPKGETPRGNSEAAARRDYRATRRLNRRKKFRKKKVRRLFINNHLLTQHQIHNVFNQSPMPSVYDLRVKSLTKPLTNSELFQVLYYFAGHRGFHSNRKYALKSKDVGPLLKSLKSSKNKLENFNSVGELLDKDFDSQKRNRRGKYLFTASRSMITGEAKAILENQLKLNHSLSKSFTKKYLSILTSQRNYDQGPSKPSQYAGNQIEKMIGHDTLDHTQQRASKATYTFKYYQLLCNLSNLKYKKPLQKWQPLNEKQRKIIIKLCFTLRKVNFKQIKKALNLDSKVSFNLVNYSSYKSTQEAEQKTKFDSFKNIQDIQSALPKNLRSNYKLVDKVGEILTKFASDEARTKAFYKSLNLPKSVVSKLLFLNFSKFGKLSLKTMRKLIPYLEKGYNLHDAISKAGFKHNNRITTKYIHENVKNPVVMRAFTITRKLARAIINKFGKPDAINIELARDLAKPYSVRRKIQKHQKKFQNKNAGTITWLTNHGYEVNGQNIIIKNLFDEQKGVDPYTNQKMDINKVFNGNGNYYNIDHIVPYSWTFNDSFTNKVLTSTKANEDKGNRLPLQYLKNNPKQQKALVKFATTVIKNYKKRTNLLRPSMNKKQLNEWKSKNLNDTRYLNKLLANYFQQNVKFNSNCNLGKLRVIRLNGSMTAKMRHRWGLAKVRIDGDKHHALDATVIASVTPALVKEVNDFSKYYEIKDNPKLWSRNNFTELKKRALHNKVFTKFFNAFPLPWPDFRRELQARLSSCPSKIMKGQHWNHYTRAEIDTLHPVHVVHKVSHKINGKVCKDTIRSAKYFDKGLIMSRFNVTKLKVNKHGEIKAGFYKYLPRKDDSDKVMRDQLKKQMEIHNYNGKDAFPKGFMTYRDSNKHQHIIREVKMFKKSTSGVLSDNNQAINDNGKVVRIDVFWDKKNKKYCYVPIYLKDVLKPKLPTQIAKSGKKPSYLDGNDKFKFSLYPWTPVHIVFKKPREIKWIAKDHEKVNAIKDFYGYYLKPSVNTGAINLMAFDRSFYIFSIGLGSIRKFTKMNIDYLGNVYKVHNHRRVPFNFKK